MYIRVIIKTLEKVNCVLYLKLLFFKRRNVYNSETKFNSIPNAAYGQKTNHSISLIQEHALSNAAVFELKISSNIMLNKILIMYNECINICSYF